MNANDRSEHNTALEGHKAQPLHEHIVQRPPPTIPAHRDPSLLQAAGVLSRRELRALVGVEDLRPSPRQRFVQRLQAEPPVQGIPTPLPRPFESAKITDAHRAKLAAETPAADRKEIIRALVERVTVSVAGDSESVLVHIRWMGGTFTEHPLRRPISHYERLADFPRINLSMPGASGAGSIW